MSHLHLTRRGGSPAVWNDPFKDMDDLLRGFFVQPVEFDQAAQQMIKVDVNEKSDQYLIRAEIPGAKKENIDVAIEGNVIIIGTEIQREEEEKEGDKVLRRERFYGKMQRTLQLPHDIDEGKAEASYENGVLTLALPKKAPDVQKKLTIK
ncbi:MAG: Hsp20/alpha crystallin family protein [Burkholderiales bacterium]|nr:Hsp20/alpha crystallin family protein [Burkholderiales bacterium]